MSFEANGTAQSIHLWAKHAFQNDKQQQQAFCILAAKFVLTYMIDDINYNIRSTELLREMLGTSIKNQQLLMFVTGPSGSGKSKIIKELVAYGKKYCNSIRQPFTQQTILVTTPSYIAANLIDRQSMYSTVFLNIDKRNIPLDTKKIFQNSVRMLILDDISMISPSDLMKLNTRMNWLMDKTKGLYGGIDVLFTGDFQQMPPASIEMLYEMSSNIFEKNINCFIPLKGMFIQKQDPKFAQICSRFHHGRPTSDDSTVISAHHTSFSNCNVACKFRNGECVVICNNVSVYDLVGLIVDELYIRSWNHAFREPYALLSRVRSSQALFLRKPLHPK